MAERVSLSGWGRTAPTTAAVVHPETEAEVAMALTRCGGRGVIARGLGRSYGDAAQCAGGTVVDMRKVSWISEPDPVTGDVEVGGGVSLHDLVASTLPRGWFLPVSPGTSQVTVGGAIAADVHGKNHHRDGSFARHVRAMSVLNATGVNRVAPDCDPELFWATAGGMGLTGLVTRATVRMTAVETDQMVVDTDRFADLDGVMAAMASGDFGYRYSVAWVDCASLGRRAGRAVLTRGDHATRSDLPARRRDRPPVAPGGARLRVPRPAPTRLLNPLTVAAFNEMWFRRAPRHRVGQLEPLGAFFHPLDKMADWNLLYGDRGFLQYQFVVGPTHGDVVVRAIALLRTSRLTASLAVLKRFGPQDGGPLSFPMAGWTLALDLPVGSPELGGLLDHLDELVAAVGGRVYLAKDARLRPELLAAMYPRIGEISDVRRRVDPRGVLTSDLARRLGIG